MNLCYFGVGGLNNHRWSVDGGKFIRIPLILTFLIFDTQNTNIVTWVGFNKDIENYNPWLELLGIKETEFKFSIEHVKGLYNVGNNFTEKDIENCDACLIELRPFESKPGYNFEEECKVQKYLIDYFYSKNKLVLVWDQDVWYNQIPDEYAKKVVLLEPYEKNTMDYRYIGKEKLSYCWSTCFPGVYNNIHKYGVWNSSLRKKFDFMYIGNTYERREEFLKFTKRLNDEKLKFGIAGNWLRKKYDDRDFSLDNLNNFMFFGTISPWAIIPLTSMSNCTFHVSSIKQQEIGLITSRVFESFMGGSLLFANRNIFNIGKYVPDFQLVSSDDELFDKYSFIKKHDLFLEYFNAFIDKIGEYNVFNQVKNLKNIIKKYM